MKKACDAGVAARTLLFAAVVFLMVAVQAAGAREIAGIAIPETITVDNKVLVLNGAGIRKKLFIKVYVGALYLAVKRATVHEILADPGAKSIVMNFLYKKVETEKLVAGWNKGFTDNTSAEELRELQDRINRFNSWFTTVYNGDVIRLEYVPQKGTLVWINDTIKGMIVGEDFWRALLNIWLGPEPADEDLKAAMLGKE